MALTLIRIPFVTGSHFDGATAHNFQEQGIHSQFFGLAG